MTDRAGEIASILERAADLIEPEGAWCQVHACRDESGQPCHWDNAVCFCAFGAIWAVGNGQQIYADAMQFANDFVGGDGIIEFNDEEGRTQAEVVAKLREAAHLAKPMTEQGE